MLERTFLFGLVLAGAGTAGVESLRSYILRLAFAHCVKPRRLIEMLFERYPLGGPSIYLPDLLKLWDIHANGEVGPMLLSRLELATGQDLKAGTLSGLAHLFAGQHLVKPGRGRYCPECVKEDNAYGRLLWEVACVKACPVHRVRLRDAAECGSPKSEHLKLNARPRLSHVCTTCGIIGFACVTAPAEPATDDEVWVAEHVARMLGCREALPPLWTQDSLRLGLNQVVKHRYGGSVVNASLSAGLSRASVSTWCAGVYRPSFAGLVQLCHHAQVDVVGLLSGRCDVLPRQSSTAELVAESEDAADGAQGLELDATTHGSGTELPGPRAPLCLFERSYVRRSCSLQDIKTALELAVGESPPPNLRQLGERLGTSARFINEKWPDQARKLVAASARHRDAVNETKFGEAVEAYASAARALSGASKPITEKYLQKAAGVVAFSQNRTRRRAMDLVIKQFGAAA